MKYLGVAALVGLTGCIWSPNDRSVQESTTPIALTGYTFDPSDTVTLTATNLTTGVMTTLGTATSSSSATYDVDGQDLYQWTTTLTPPANFWAPQISAGNQSYSLGRLEIFGTNSSDQTLYTFSAAQQSCMFSDMFTEGLGPAFEACGGSFSLVVFDNTGVATAPPTSSFTQLSGPHTYTQASEPTVTWEVDSYQVGLGSGTPLTVYNFLCLPTTGSEPYPVQFYNHGGYTGLTGTINPTTGAATGNLGDCIAGAQSGWITAMSAFRGEPLVLTGPGLTSPPTPDPSNIETCLGEVTDVLRLTTLVLALPHADSTRVLMMGWSEGGCITDRAVEQGAPVQAAVTFSAMTDLGATASFGASQGVPAPWPMYDSWGYTTTTAPLNFYAWRAPTNFYADMIARTDVRTLMLQAVQYSDGMYWDTVLEPGVACDLANLLDSSTTNVYVDTSGIGLGGTPPDCGSYSALTWSAAGTDPFSWTWPQRTLIEVDGLTHYNLIKNESIFSMFLDFVRLRGSGWTTPYPTGHTWLGD